MVPTRNRAASLKRTLTSFVSLRYPAGAYEVVVVDNGSTDDTRAAAEAIVTSHPDHCIRYCFEPVPGLLSGRHRGALEARSDLLVFVDDDIEAGTDWLAAIVDTFKDATVHLVGGRNLPVFESAPPDWLQAFWTYQGDRKICSYLSLLDLGEKSMEIDPIYVCGLNFAIRRQTLFDLGGFHPDCIPKHLQRYQGDGENGLSLKARTRGLKAVYQPRALVYHVIPSQRLTVEYFEERQFYQGVCDSYTSIRALGAPGSPPPAWKKPLRRIKRFVKDLVRVSPQNPYQKIKTRIHRAYEAGYSFHQQQVRNDPALLEWVLKADYWDYRLPLTSGKTT